MPLYVQEGPLKILAECAGHLFGLYVSTRLEMARAGISKQVFDEDDNEIPDKDKHPFFINCSMERYLTT